MRQELFDAADISGINIRERMFRDPEFRLRMKTADQWLETVEKVAVETRISSPETRRIIKSLSHKVMEDVNRLDQMKRLVEKYYSCIDSEQINRILND